MFQDFPTVNDLPVFDVLSIEVQWPPHFIFRPSPDFTEHSSYDYSTVKYEYYAIRNRLTDAFVDLPSFSLCRWKRFPLEETRTSGSSNPSVRSDKSVAQRLISEKIERWLFVDPSDK